MVFFTSLKEGKGNTVIKEVLLHYTVTYNMKLVKTTFFSTNTLSERKERQLILPIFYPQRERKVIHRKLVILHMYKYNVYTICSKRSAQFYIVSYYIKWVTTSWIYSNINYIISQDVIALHCKKNSMVSFSIELLMAFQNELISLQRD